MELRMVLRSLMVLLLLGSWLAISNHCALAALAPPSTAVESCPMHPQPAKQKSDSSLICCKILRAPSAPAVMKVPAPVPSPDSDFAFADASVGDLGLREPPRASPDTGPPLRFSFAESVLQRSLRAHAPPSLG